MKRISRIIYLILAIIFALSIVAQIFLAGMATFVSPMHWLKHVTFVHLFGFNIPVVMLVFAYLGRLPRWAYWQLFAVLVSVFLMYFTANITATLPWASAMHPLIGVVLFVLAYVIIKKMWVFIFTKTSQKEVE
ncbi:DUF6220 domain-containing protein [Virgibacillus flavescens]|uniref:DUF6220 domain-containing protein n=1 Tax=Virgibacillus flavescens TaxID=1611422 RepID=UPI003D339CD2